MLYKGRILAAMAAFGACGACTEGRAQPPYIPAVAQSSDTVMTKVDYYYSERYGDPDYYGYQGSPLDIPFKLVGGLFSGLLGGGPEYESYYARPCRVSAYYGSPYYYQRPERYESYSRDPYDGDGYYLDSRYGDDRYTHRASHREYERNVGYDYSYYYPDGNSGYRYRYR